MTDEQLGIRRVKNKRRMFREWFMNLVSINRDLDEGWLNCNQLTEDIAIVFLTAIS